MNTTEYLSSAETNRHRELTHGLVREPPSPFFSHQEVVFRAARLLREHVEPRGLGVVAIAPLDVVLDSERNLIVQPDVLFVSSPRLSIIRNQVWGAPDLVVEVSSPSSRVYDQGEKLTWYQQYGVREYWLIDLYTESVSVVDFSSVARDEHRVRGAMRIPTTLFPDLLATPKALFD